MADAKVFGGLHEGDRGPFHTANYRTAGRNRQYFESGLSILLSYSLRQHLGAGVTT
jgi:hypothetical protein